MSTIRNRRTLRSTLALVLAALLAGNACAATEVARTETGPVASLGGTDLLRTGAAPDALAPGQFEWLPGSEISTGAPILVMVSLKDQRAYIYRDGQPIAVSTVSTGQPGYDTPTGSFAILEKKKVHHSNRYEDNRGRPAAMPFMQRLTWDGVALHAGRVMPRPASHGCVRLPLKFAEQLFKLTQHGGTVVISNDGSVDSLARAGMDMQLALLIGTATSLHEMTSAVLVERAPPSPEGASGGGRATAFSP